MNKVKKYIALLIVFCTLGMFAPAFAMDPSPKSPDYFVKHPYAIPLKIKDLLLDAFMKDPKVRYALAEFQRRWGSESEDQARELIECIANNLSWKLSDLVKSRAISTACNPNMNFIWQKIRGLEFQINKLVKVVPILIKRITVVQHQSSPPRNKSRSYCATVVSAIIGFPFLITYIFS